MVTVILGALLLGACLRLFFHESWAGVLYMIVAFLVIVVLI